MKVHLTPKQLSRLWLLLIAPWLWTGTARAEAEAASTPAAPAVSDNDLPYVYAHWQQFTEQDGLPNDHVFAVKVDGPRVWIGTEGGLACYDKRTKKMKSWTEKDGLPWRVVHGIAVDEKTGEVWIAMMGGGLARFSGGRFDHFNQLNSGLANNVVYAVTVGGGSVWIATTAGANRYDPVKDKWEIFTEKNAPMEEIWNYGVNYNEEEGLLHLAVWGGGVLEYNVARNQWKTYLDPDGEMEIDLYRDDGIVHVITTAVTYVEKVLWVSTYFGGCRYDGRHWKGFFSHDCGLPSEFNNSVKGRSAQEGWFCSDKGLGVCAEADSDTWVTYKTDGTHHRGQAIIKRGPRVLKVVETGYNTPHNFIQAVDFDGKDAWVATSKGLGWAIGKDYYPRLKHVDPPPLHARAGQAANNSEAK